MGKITQKKSGECQKTIKKKMKGPVGERGWAHRGDVN